MIALRPQDQQLPTRMRPETFTSWDRGRDRDRDQKKWSRDHAGLETLTSLVLPAVTDTDVL